MDVPLLSTDGTGDDDTSNDARYRQDRVMSRQRSNENKDAERNNVIDVMNARVDGNRNVNYEASRDYRGADRSNVISDQGRSDGSEYISNNIKEGIYRDVNEKDTESQRVGSESNFPPHLGKPRVCVRFLSIFKATN